MANHAKSDTRDPPRQGSLSSAVGAGSDHYRELFERSPAALYRTAPEGGLLHANPALVSLLGYPDRQAFMAVNAADVYLDREDRRRWRELLEHRERVVFEMRDRRNDGSIIWVRDTARAVRNEAGEVVCYEGMLEDITTEKEVKETRLGKEERFRLLGRASDDVIWDWNVSTGVVQWNEALKEVFGYDPKSIGAAIERSHAWWLRRVDPEDRDRVAEMFHAAVRGGGSSWAAKYRFRRLDGSYADVQDRGFIGRDAEGRPVRMVGAMLDLDRRRPHDEEQEIAFADGPAVPRTSDATLMSWVGNGDERAFDDLYARHAGTVLAVARQTAMSTEDAEEVVADVFLRAWAEAARYDPDRGSVTSWLTTMARSRSLERTRKQRRRSRLLESELHRADSSASGVMGNGSGGTSPASLYDRMILETSLAELPEPQRRVLELAYFAGHSHSEIAAKLEQPLGTVKTRIRAGLARMRRGVQPDD